MKPRTIRALVARVVRVIRVTTTSEAIHQADEEDLGEAMLAVKQLVMSAGPDDDPIGDAYSLIEEKWPDLEDTHKGFAVGCAMGYASGICDERVRLTESMPAGIEGSRPQ